MKKIITFSSFALIMGLSFIGYKNTQIDTLLGTEDKGEKTYLVKVDGTVSGTDEEKAVAEKNRNQVLSELALKLGEDSYEVTYVYDSVYNGFAIKTTSDKADILKNTLHVRSVNESHTYAAPDGTGANVNFSSSNSKDEQIKKDKLANYSSETMKSTKDDIEAVVGTGNYNGGEGITIGILDTGLYMNQVEGTAARTSLENDSSLNTKINKAAFKPLASGIEQKFTRENLANKTGKNFTYVNSKIPYAYDYAGNDNDVDPTENGENHGTHVASLAGANGEDFQGIAPNAQICVMKVFGDNSGGATTDAVIAAINDAKKLGLDEINMSLGSDLLDCGADNDGIDNEAYQALKECADAGVICNISAGNAGKSSFSSGNYSDYTTDTVEGGILGSYANYDEAANIVASSNPDKAFYSSIMNVKQTGSETVNAVSYSDQVVSSSTQTFLKDRYLTDLLGYKEVNISEEEFNANKTSYYVLNNNVYVACKDTDTYDLSKKYYEQDTTVEKEYVVVGGYGESKDYKNLDVQGKVAVVHRGNTTFVQKYQTAEANGAIALVVINNSPSTTFNFTMAFSDNSPNIPVVFVFQNSTSSWGNAGQTGTITLMRNTVTEAGDGNTVSSYSSDGPSSNLDIGPSISAPGSSVIGAVSAAASNAITGGTTTGISGLYGYENMSGTSMAAPNLTGALAVALSQKKAEIENDASLTTDEQKTTAYNEYKATLSNKAMSTADQLLDGTKENENSPRMQGAGRVNIKSILASDSYVTVPNADDDDFGNTTQSKVELKNSGSLYVKDGDFSTAGEAYIEFDYTIHNDDSVAKTYTPEISVMIPQLEITTTHSSYAAEQADSRKEEVGYSDEVTFNESDADTYPTFVGTPTMSVNDDDVLAYGDSAAKLDSASTKTITVAANSTTNAKVKIRIDNLHFEKDWNDGTYIENFSGTLKDYIAKYFSGAAGTFVEGYLKLTETSNDDNETLTVPYLGFYGDYSSADAVEPFDFEKEDAIVDGKYNSNYHVYNSDLADNYLQHLNDTYKKPNAYTGSALSASASSLTSSQIEKICNFTSKPTANGSDLFSVVDTNKTHLYAGSSSSQHLNAFFYVNRSVSEAKWYVKDSSGKVLNSGDVSTLMQYGTGYTATTQYGLVKSWISTNDSGYTINRGYADINVSSIKEGEYTLEFDFTLKGAKDASGNAVKQTKSYPLTIDKTSPTITSIKTESVGTGTRLVVTAKGANDIVKIGSSNVVPTLVDGTTDTYTASSRLTSSILSNGKVNVTLSDYAHNSTIVMVHTNDLTFSVSSTFFTDKNDFSVTLADEASNMYTIDILDKNGNPIDANKLNTYTLHIQLESGLSASDLEIQLDSVTIDASQYSYDASSGMLSVKIKKGTLSIQLNQKPKKASDGTSSSSSSSSSTVDSTSSSTAADESTSSNSEGKKRGCGGSVIAASSIVASLGLVGLGLVLKKKKEDK